MAAKRSEVTIWLEGKSFVVEAPYSPTWIAEAKRRFGRWDSLRGHNGWFFEHRLDDHRVRQMASAAKQIFGTAPRIVDLDVVAA